MKENGASPRAVAMPGPVDYKDIPRKMKLEYGFPTAGKTYKILENIGQLLAHFQKSELDLQALMIDAANLMMRQFSLRTVAIGLRDPDGNYRYKALLGLRPETEAANRKITYTPEQFFDATVYKGTMISKYTKVFLAEDNPWLESEREAYNLPSLLGMTRRSLDDYMEGDYIDIHVLGKDEEVIGWIELSGTNTGKIPDVTALRWMEFIGQIIGAAVMSLGPAPARG